MRWPGRLAWALNSACTVATLGGSGRKPEESAMAWKKPRVVEVSLALEINAYACAEIG